MKLYKREKYNLKEYHQEKYMMEITDEDLHISSTKYSDEWQTLYYDAKKESAKGKHCAIWELKYEFEG